MQFWWPLLPGWWPFATRSTEFQFYWYYNSTCFGQPFCPSSGVLSRTSALVQFMQFWWPLLPGWWSFATRSTEFQFYWYYNSTCFGQPFCPSSGVLSRTSALVHFMQFWWPLLPRWWPFATRSTEFQFYWYYNSTCFGQPFCPSSGVLSCTSALVHFMQFWWLLLPGWWPFATVINLVATTIKTA